MKKKLSAIRLINEIMKITTISIPSDQTEKFDRLINEVYNDCKQEIIDAYQEGYDAAFHHEQSLPETYLADTYE